MMYPCIRCGVLVSTVTRQAGAICTTCKPIGKETEARYDPPRDESRGYGTAWDRLSRKARRLQPWCLDCGTTDDLSADHLPVAHWKQAHQIPLTLFDVEVVCGPCNSKRKSSRPGTDRYYQWHNSENGRRERALYHGVNNLDISPDEYDRGITPSAVGGSGGRGSAETEYGPKNSQIQPQIDPKTPENGEFERVSVHRLNNSHQIVPISPSFERTFSADIHPDYSQTEYLSRVNNAPSLTLSIIDPDGGWAE